METCVYAVRDLIVLRASIVVHFRVEHVWLRSDVLLGLSRMQTSRHMHVEYVPIQCSWMRCDKVGVLPSSSGTADWDTDKHIWTVHT